MPTITNEGTTSVGLRVANRVLRDRAQFEALLRDGLNPHVANASTIRDWLKETMSRLGAKPVIEIVGERMKDDPDAVARALYWLPSLVGADQGAQALLGQLRDELDLANRPGARPTLI
jgi:hypothetical protein